MAEYRLYRFDKDGHIQGPPLSSIAKTMTLPLPKRSNTWMASYSNLGPRPLRGRIAVRGLRPAQQSPSFLYAILACVQNRLTLTFVNSTTGSIRGLVMGIEEMHSPKY